MATTNCTITRTATKVFEAIETEEGVGAKVRRSIGTYGLRNLDPFLMLDHTDVSPPAGFSDHPHRGFETVSYMLKGEFEHEDFAGHKGRIGPGDLQWMTAGRGIVHAEVPVTDETEGLQLWVNLPAKHKMMEPRYQELRGVDLPVAEPTPGVHVKLIAGSAFGKVAKVHTLTPICYFDVTMQPDTHVTIPVPSNFNAFVYLMEGAATVGGRDAKQYDAVVLDTIANATTPDSEVHVTTAGDKGARFVVLGGEPIGGALHFPFFSLLCRSWILVLIQTNCRARCPIWPFCHE
ncbi:RmlC-like cupin domain-containing protein [Blastocladiella britannica]|nr:RmlC-like cupin domain-containing protein [Blastocladiella britannica]